MHAATIFVGLAAIAPALVSAQAADAVCSTYVYSTDTDREQAPYGTGTNGEPSPYGPDMDGEGALYFQQNGYSFQSITGFVWRSYNSYVPFAVEQEQRQQAQQKHAAQCKAHNNPQQSSKGEWGHEKATSTQPWGGQETGSCNEDYDEDYPFLVPIYRWYRAATSDFYYTADPNDLAGPAGYVYEGVKFYVMPEDGFAFNLEGRNDVVPLYQWYSEECGTHFYTTDPSGERAVQNGYEYERILGWIRITEGEGSEPLYRYTKTVAEDPAADEPDTA